MRRHRDRLWAVALRTIGDREEAADAVQDALLSAHRNAARFRGDSAVTTWLHRIVVNSCLDRIRRRQAHRQREPRPVRTMETPCKRMRPLLAPQPLPAKRMRGGDSPPGSLLGQKRHSGRSGATAATTPQAGRGSGEAGFDPLAVVERPEVVRV